MKKFITLTISLALTAVIFAACTPKISAPLTSEDGIDLSSYPIETDVVLSCYVNLPPAIANLVDNYGDTPIAKELYKRTGVKIDYIHPAAGQSIETLNLLIASDNLPDIINLHWIDNYPGGPEKAIDDHVIISLNAYREYAPAMFGFLDKIQNPEYDKVSKTDADRYYGFFHYNDPDGENFVISGPLVRTDWLRELGIPEPETIDDWEAMLTAFRDKKGATAPLSFVSLHQIMNVLESANWQYIKAGAVVYGAVQPEFRRAVTLLNDWFNKGLLDQNIASIDQKILDSQVLTGKTGATVGSGGKILGSYMKAGAAANPSFELTGLKYPVFERGTVNGWRWYDSGQPSTGWAAAISAQCKYPRLAAKVLDYLYTDEGRLLACFGVEGVSYTMTDGEPVYTDLIMSNPDGLSIPQALLLNCKSGEVGPHIDDERYLLQFYALPQQKTSLSNWMVGFYDAYKRAARLVTPTSEESEEYAQIISDVNKYKAQMVIKFITGVEPLEKWDEYVGTMNRLGLPRAMEIQTGALKRYNSR